MPTASPSTSKNTAKASRQRVTNDHTSDKPPQGEMAGFRPPEAEVGPLHGTNSSRSKPQDVDPTSLAQTPAGQGDRPPPLQKDPPTSRRLLLSPAPGMTSAESRLTSEPVPGEPQTPRGAHVPPGASSLPNESGGTAQLNMTGGHDPSNGQPAPNNVSSLPVRHFTTKRTSFSATYHSNHLPRPVALTIYTPQAADNSLTSPAPIDKQSPRAPPKAVVSPLNGTGSEYGRGTGASRDFSESPDYAGAIGRTTVTAPSLSQPTPVLSSPTNNDVREASMAPTHDSSTSWSQSDDNLPSSIPQINDRVTDWVSSRAANGTVREGGSPYSSSTRRGYGSAVELREHGAGANSAVDLGQSSRGRGPPPTFRRFVAPQTKASKSFQPAAYADAELFVPGRADSVCDPLSFNPCTCDSNFRPQPHKGANGTHNPASPALSTAESSYQLAPNGLHTTRRAGGPMNSPPPIQSNEEPHPVTSLPTSNETAKPSRAMRPNAPPPVTTSPSTSTNTSEPPRKRTSNDRSSINRFREKAGPRPPEAEVGPLSGTSSS
jgi:hypothetical protein